MCGSSGNKTAIGIMVVVATGCTAFLGLLGLDWIGLDYSKNSRCIEGGGEWFFFLRGLDIKDIPSNPTILEDWNG